MRPIVKLQGNIKLNDHLIIIAAKKINWKEYKFSAEEIKFIEASIKNKEKIISLNQYKRWVFIIVPETDNKKIKDNFQFRESLRKTAYKLSLQLKTKNIKSVCITDSEKSSQNCFDFTEGLLLSNYQFLKYFKDSDKKENKLRDIHLILPDTKKSTANKLNIIAEAVYKARDLVNEPSNYLTATQLAEEAKLFCVKAGCTVEVFNKKKIESLKLGGLLAVNKGSMEPPTFSMIEWKPAKIKNKKPYILVGKGLVFDTGGLSLKSPSGMDAMKSDMGGAAAVIGSIYAIAKAKLPVHVIGLIPSTDNRPGENAYAPQDVIKMHNGMSVEVLNTDAEGRIILADALSYAQQFKPELVIDLATLTGAATVATGQHGIVAMGTANDNTFEKLNKSGFNCYERIVKFPLWDEYKEYIKSDIADIKNVGNREAGAITAGKFLECFTNYPWIHLDIAGSAYLDYQTHYRGKAASGIGVRLLFDFFQNL